LNNRNHIFFLVLATLVVLLFFADILVGSVLSAGEVWRALIKPGADPDARYIVMNFRLPRATTALLAGASLSAVGLQMQTLFRNPLAGPYVLGVSSGASLGVALYTLGLPLAGVSLAGAWWANLGMAGAAWTGAAVVLVVIMAVAARIKDIMAVLLLGIMFGSAATAVVEILQFMSPEGAVKGFVVWTMGSLGDVTGAQMRVMVPVLMAGLAISAGLVKSLNMLLLGENYARTMGLDIRATRLWIMAATVLLAGTVTAYCGPIGFVGLAVPHIARMVFREADHRILMPASMLIGAGVMLFCDIISRLSSTVLPINTITALVGIPVVIIVIIRYRK
jgi:iron complex transport system permease protein